MKILLIQSPRRYWPFLSEGDNYILPQWLPYIASSLRQAGHEVECIDCVAMKIGWKSLESIIRKKNPDVIGISEAHALYMNESLRLAKLIKEINKNIVVICGGGQFANTSKETLIAYEEIDYIVRGEGEGTVIELLNKLENEQPAESVKGIAYVKNNKYFQTHPRPLVQDMDNLPFPAYDLMPMDRYGKSKYLFSPGGITIHHSRGCTSNCSFCVWWTQMAERKIEDNNEKLYPRWRTMSVKRSIEEILYLKNKYNRNCFIFVDDSWNINPEWNAEFADEIIKRGLNINWFAFMRIDCILRDEKLGIMEKLVKSGLSHICIGAEHCSRTIMKDFNKKIQNSDTTKECIRLIRKKYPEVFIQATFIVGTRNESKHTLKKLSGYVKNLRIDYPAFHAFTPVPGTELYKESKRKEWLEIQDFSFYDWNTPIISTKYLSRKDMEWELYRLYKKSISFRWFLRGLFSKNPYKRNMYIWWLIVTIRVTISSLKDIILPAKQATGLVTPQWYDK
jgi:anaerobic magnesium-protoporphyrin IX monomethyl ester cyclase